MKPEPLEEGRPPGPAVDQPQPLVPTNRAERWVQIALLVPWACALVGLGWFAGDLERVAAPWPLHYWLAAQGIIGFFVLLAAINVWVMRRVEARGTGDTPQAARVVTAEAREH